jgi:hypothetical protein
MPNTRLVYVRGSLNDANDPTQTGMFEPITGLELPSGLVLGAWADWTDQEVQQYTNTNIGTLYAGRYQRVQLDPDLDTTASPLAYGQLLFWKAPKTLADQWQVTNVESNDVSDIAGFYLNAPTGQAGAVDAGNFFFMQAFNGGGIATVKLRAVLTGVPAIGQAVFAAAAGAGADNATADVLDGAGNPTFTDAGNMQTRYLGRAMTLPVAGGNLTIALPSRQDSN